MRLPLNLNYLILWFFLASSSLAAAQKNVTISGYARDKQTGETLIGANIFLKESRMGTTANTYGFYSLSVPPGQYTVVYSFIGYQPQEFAINLRRDTTININLETSALLDEVVIVDERSTRENTESTQMGTVELKMEEIKKIPAIFGEVDILKTIQLLPGVKSSGEGNSGFYVRGGGPDQNLIMLDNTIVYNAAHLFGFFSVFNSDAIKNVELIKGGMPAQYGGRLSSVLDISMKDGNMKSFHGEGGIGIISTRLTFEGPIVKDKLSFIVSGRRTYADVFIPLFVDEEARGNTYYFYDINAKLNWQITPKDKLTVSGYFGRDVFRFKSPSSDLQISIPWGNAIATARYSHQFGKKVFMSTTFGFTDYNFETSASSTDFDFTLYSGIRDYTLKTQVDWLPTVNHTVKFGADYTFHTFIPSTASARIGDTTSIEPNVQEYYSHDFALYAQDEFNIGTRVRINAGLRFTYYQHAGPFDRYLKDPYGQIMDTVSYGMLENIQDYARIEPRISIRIKINERSSIKAAYTLNYQNMHLANLATVSLPTDIWLPSTSIIRPQQAQQWNLGYFHNFFDNKLETSVETYYKHMENLVEYKDNTSFTQIVNDNPDNILTFGNGRAWGVEVFIRGGFPFKMGKLQSRISGWVGYTLSWTQRFGFDKQELNYDGDFFYPRYDRRHDVSVTLAWDIGKRWSIGAVFVYSTGNALAVPASYYFVGNSIVPYFEDRDNYRMAPYHRLDLSMTYTLHKGKKWSHSLNLSIYNVYSRMNPFFVYFDIKTDPQTNAVGFVGKQVSLFPVIPALTWNFKF